MLVLPKPEGFSDEAWKVAEYQAMTEVVGLYGKTWHFWEIDADHDIPLGLRYAPSPCDIHADPDQDIQN